MAKSRVRRTFKDSLFRMIFSGKEELEIFTIEDVLYMGMKNDVSYLDLYSGVQLKLPSPRYIVFYNGTDKMEEQRRLCLSDSFLKQDETGYALECTAVLLNINYGHNKEVMKNCRKLYEYVCLVEEIRVALKEGLKLASAVDQAVETCIGSGILEDFLRKHRAEVKDMILSEYDKELHIKCEKELSFLEGKREDILLLLEDLGPVPEEKPSCGGKEGCFFPAWAMYFTLTFPRSGDILHLTIKNTG